MAASTPTERSLSSSIAALTRWGKEDTVQGTEPARRAFLERFEREADPDMVLEPAERALRADRLRRAYFKQLALKSAKARRARKAA